MAIVAGVDFGTLSVRVASSTASAGRSDGVAEYPAAPQARGSGLRDPVARRTIWTRWPRRRARRWRTAGVDGGRGRGDRARHHRLERRPGRRASRAARRVLPLVRPPREDGSRGDHRSRAREKLEAIEWCGGVYSHEWGFAKLLHWLRHNPDKRGAFATALEHCDMVAATLCGITDPRDVKRSVCAMGHKWMWNPRWGGLPPQEFLSKRRPAVRRRRDKLDGEYLDLRQARRASRRRVGRAARPARRAFRFRSARSTPTGTRSAPAAAMATWSMWSARRPASSPWRGRAADPGRLRRRAGQRASALRRHRGRPVGDRRHLRGDRPPRRHDVSPNCRRARSLSAGQTGLLRLTWDNGDRTVLVNADLGGITLGWNLLHTAQDELFAAIEGTAFHTRIILERMAEHGVRVERVINGGGIPQNNAILNQVYANVLGKPVLVPDGIPTSLGSGIFAILAAGCFKRSKRRRISSASSIESTTPNPPQWLFTISSIATTAHTISTLAKAHMNR